MTIQFHKLLKFILQLALVALLTRDISAQRRVVEQDTIKQLFDGQYDSRIRPGSGDEPVKVAVNMYVRKMKILENGEFDVQLTYRQKWKDDRLSFKAGDLKYLNLVDRQGLTWVPDTFFANSIEGNLHDLLVKNEYLRIFPDGQVLHSSRISLKLSCPMNLQNFPFDRQECPLRLASYGYTDQDVKYVWDERNPIQLPKNLYLPTFFLEKAETTTCDSTTTTGTYSCLLATFTVKRAFSPYLINVYIPCAMMVILSFFSFWIGVRAITARMVLLIVTLTVFAIQTTSMNKDFPTVSYTRAVDMWTGVCLTFVFAALLEFVIVQHISRRQYELGKQACRDEEDEMPLKDNLENGVKTPEGKANGASSRIRRVLNKYVYNSNSLPDKIDGACKIAFPVVFILFVILYSVAYCPGSAQ